MEKFNQSGFQVIVKSSPINQGPRWKQFIVKKRGSIVFHSMETLMDLNETYSERASKLIKRIKRVEAESDPLNSLINKSYRLKPQDRLEIKRALETDLETLLA